MSDELTSIANYINDYAQAINKGFKSFMATLPVVTTSYIQNEVFKKLHKTAEPYMDAVQVNMAGDVLVVVIDKDSWLANAVENGVSGFDMKTSRLQSSKAKTSKDGFKYLSVPMGKEAGGSGGPSDKGKEIQQRINQVMNKPKFGMSQFKSLDNGQVAEMQQVFSENPNISIPGLYRTRSFNGAAEAKGSNKPFGLVLFRTMSDKPGSAPWMHPGIQAANILKDTNDWLDTHIPDMLMGYINHELDKVKF